MRFGIFYEHQLPRPWLERSEVDLLKDSLEQVELADRLGFDYVWEVEHHFLEEYSHSSAPEVFLAAASQRTLRIRLGHGIVNVMPPVNHPVRVAERIATLDLISEGRVDFGTGESSSAAEVGGFGVVREHRREMWQESLDAITRMFVEEPFAGFDGEHLRMPPRNVVPKPLQRPHPPLWVACSRRETIHLAARNGIGALSFSFVEPEQAAKWVREYYELLASDDCVPAGFAVNPAVAVVLPMMLARDESEAIERGIDGAHFFAYSLAHYYGMAPHSPGVTDVWREFLQNRDQAGFARDLVTADEGPLGVRLLEEGMGSLRGAIGTPAQVTELVTRYQAAGVDQVIFVLQSGRNRHEDICESLELFAEQVMPRFVEDRERRDMAKYDRLAGPIEAALARRAPARRDQSGYVIAEEAELARARRSTSVELVRVRRIASDELDGAPDEPVGAQRIAPFWRALRPSGGGPTGRQIADMVVDRAKQAAREGGVKLLARLVSGASDEDVERRFGSRLAQRTMFTGMARSFEPDAAAGFQGRIVYELAQAASGELASWTIEVIDGRATARPGGAVDPQLTVRLALADFVRVAAGTIDAAAPMLDNRASIEGDLSLAARLAEMFGAPSPH